MSKLTKKQRKLQELLADFNQPVSGQEALTKLQEISKEVSKFNETVECHMRLGIEVKHADQQIRGAMVLPNGTGRSQKILVVTQGPKTEEAKNAGADYVGDKEILEKIKGGWFDFDIIVATPDMMGELGKLGKILGPKGLMPNPKTGTVSPDITKAVKEIKAGKVEYRVDKEANMHVSIARVSFEAGKIAENLKALTDAIVKARPAAVKGDFIKTAVVHTTMGPSIKFTFEGR